MEVWHNLANTVHAWQRVVSGDTQRDKHTLKVPPLTYSPRALVHMILNSPPVTMQRHYMTNDKRTYTTFHPWCNFFVSWTISIKFGLVVLQSPNHNRIVSPTFMSFSRSDCSSKCTNITVFFPILCQRFSREKTVLCGQIWHQTGA